MSSRIPDRRRLAVLAAVGVLALPLLGLALLRGGSAEAGTAASPSFTRDVAPIIRDKCAGCHRLGGIAVRVPHRARRLVP